MNDQQWREALTTPLDVPVRHRKAQQGYEQGKALKRLNEWLKEHGAALLQQETKANV